MDCKEYMGTYKNGLIYLYIYHKEEKLFVRSLHREATLEHMSGDNFIAKNGEETVYIMQFKRNDDDTITSLIDKKRYDSEYIKISNVSLRTF